MTVPVYINNIFKSIITVNIELNFFLCNQIGMSLWEVKNKIESSVLNIGQFINIGSYLQFLKKNPCVLEFHIGYITVGEGFTH